MKIEAAHGARDTVDIQTAPTRPAHPQPHAARRRISWTTSSPCRGGCPSTCPWQLPRGRHRGTSAEVTVETVHGGVRGRRVGHGSQVRSVMGQITVDKASGRVQATSVNEGIRLTNVTGDMTAETTNGDIVIDNAQTSSLEASTVSSITFNGTLRDGGAYRLTTHSGDVRIGIGSALNATVFVRTFQGDFSSDLPINCPRVSRATAAASGSASRSAAAVPGSGCSRSMGTSTWAAARWSRRGSGASAARAVRQGQPGRAPGREARPMPAPCRCRCPRRCSTTSISRCLAPLRPHRGAARTTGAPGAQPARTPGRTARRHEHRRRPAARVRS
ncbi:MAG: hypothetical protein R2712_01925 [Vicinamibacterales bacterium]